MGIFDFYRKHNDHREEIERLGFKVSECDQECESCTSKYPSSLKLNEGADDDLWGSTKPYGLHIVIPTNKSDWPHDAVSGSGPFARNVESWAASSLVPLGDLNKVKVTVCSLSSFKLETDAEFMEGRRGDLLLLPFFVWVKNIGADEVKQTLNEVVPKLVEFRDEQLTKLPEMKNLIFPAVSVEIDQSSAYVFLCSHRTRDKKCGVTAPIIKKEMDLYLRELGLHRDFDDSRTGGVKVAYVNHIGGHKYAANVIIYLRKSGKNIWLARCKPNNVIPIIDECIVNDGHIWPNKVRQIQKFKPITW